VSMSKKLWRNEAELAELSEKFMLFTEHSFERVYNVLAYNGMLTQKNIEDYIEFRRVAREIHAETGLDFKLRLVIDRLPNNTWFTLFQKYVPLSQYSIATVH